MKYSRNCEEISLYNFDKVGQGDLRYILMDWDGYDEVEIDKEKAEDLWYDIFNEYCVLEDDNKMMLYYDSLIELNNLRSKKYVVEGLCKMFYHVTDRKIAKQFYEEFKAWKFPMDPKKRRTKEIDRVLAELNFLVNKIELKEHEVELMKGEGKHTPLLQQVVAVEKLTGRNEIDPKKISVAKWIYIKKTIPNGRK